VNTPSGYAGKVVTKAPAWHDLVVFDVVLNNLATGLLLAAAVAEFASPAGFASVARWAYFVALVLLLADLGLLVLDLGDKLRFHHMLRVFKPSSPMSLGTWCLTLFSFFLTAILAIEVFLPANEVAWWLHRIAVIGGLPFAFGSAAYKGVLFSTTAQPGWKDARWLGAYLINSAILLGTAELIVLAAIVEPQAAERLAPPAILLSAINLVAFLLLANDLEPTLARCYSRRNRILGVAGYLSVGIALPILVWLFGRDLLPVVTAFLAVLAAHLSVRFVIVRLPHHVS
jgi:hypothetical protein